MIEMMKSVIYIVLLYLRVINYFESIHLFAFLYFESCGDRWGGGSGFLTPTRFFTCWVDSLYSRVNDNVPSSVAPR